MEYCVDYDCRNRHGFPQGVHYLPTPLELIDLLGDKLAGRPLPDPLPAIFTDVRIRDFNPVDLHEQYKEREEAGYIYFFSERELANPGGASKRPARRTANGGWKGSGASKPVNGSGGVEVGRQLTMVFPGEQVSRRQAPRQDRWAMHEFAKIIGPGKKLANMAIYRLYKRSGKAEAGRCVGAAAAATTHDESQPPPDGMNDHEASTSTSQPQAQAGAGAYQPRRVMPVAVTPPPVQLQDAGNTSSISCPAPSMAADASPAANSTPPMSHHHQQQQEGVRRSNSVDCRMSPEMFPPPPPTLMAPVSEPAVICPPPSSEHQQQLGEQFSSPEHENSDGQLPKNDLSPPPATVSLPAEDPRLTMMDKESQLCTFTIDELLGTISEWAPVTMLEEEAGTNEQQPGST